MKRFCPALLALPAACAHALPLHVDMSRQVDMQIYDAAIAGLQRCDADAALIISYAFGDLELTSNSFKKDCQIEVSVIGELTPQGTRKKFLCHADVLSRVPWLKQGDAVRTRPPVNELRQLASCEASKQ